MQNNISTYSILKEIVSEIDINPDNQNGIERILDELSPKCSNEMLVSTLKDMKFFKKEIHLILLIYTGLKIESTELINYVDAQVLDNHYLADLIVPYIESSAAVYNNIINSVTDPNIILSFGHLLEVISIYIDNPVIRSTIRNLYTRLPENSLNPPLLKIKKYGGKVYYFEKYEAIAIERELNAIYNTSLDIGLTTNIGLCSYYLWLFFCKIIDKKIDTIAIDIPSIIAYYDKALENGCEFVGNGRLQNHISYTAEEYLAMCSYNLKFAPPSDKYNYFDETDIDFDDDDPFDFTVIKRLNKCLKKKKKRNKN